MKVLFISKADLPDFQSDMVFHGLRSLLGADCIDANHMWYMYSDTMEAYWNTRVPNNGKSYGNGFTLYGLLENIDIDRNDIHTKIKDKYKSSTSVFNTNLESRLELDITPDDLKINL